MRFPPCPREFRGPLASDRHRLEPARQFARGLRPVRRVLGQAREHDRIELLRNRQFRPCGWRLRHRLRVLDEELHRRVAGEDELTREQPVREAAGPVDVGTVIHRSSPERLLGRDERRRAAHDVLGGERGERRRRFGSARLVRSL